MSTCQSGSGSPTVSLPSTHLAHVPRKRALAQTVVRVGKYSALVPTYVNSCIVQDPESELSEVSTLTNNLSNSF